MSSGLSLSITCPELEYITDWFTNQFRPLLLENLRQANLMITGQMRADLADLYTPALSQLWTIDADVMGASGTLATVHVWTDDKRVFGYEFGTRAHLIFPKSSGGVLSFLSGGGQIEARSVQHPGTPPHNRRDTVQERLAAYCLTRWQSAIRDTLARVAN